SIGNAIRNYGWKETRVLRELAKCVPMCGNCHKAYHIGNGTTSLTPGQLLVREYKRINSCQCGENRWQCLEFHHVDPQYKIMCICDMVTRNVALETVKAEMAKCRVLCTNCHRDLEFQTRLVGG